MFTSKCGRLVSLIMVFVIVFSMLPTVAYAKTDIKTGIAVINGNALRLRTEPNTTSKVKDYAEKNDIAVVLGREGDWYKVNYNLQEGYMHADYLKFCDRENAELGYGEIKDNYVNIRSGPSVQKKSLGMLNKGDRVYIIGINNGWYKVIFENTIGYMRSDYVHLTEIPYENKDSKNTPLFFKKGNWIVSKIDPNLLRKNDDSNDDSQNDEIVVGNKAVMEIAESCLGVPYVWGGTTMNGFDCSGFVYYVYNKAGYKLSRSMSVQAKTGEHVDKEDLQPGDIVFFQNTYESGLSHVGIYAGDGKFIHAPSTGKTVSYSDLNSSYYTAHYYGARRIS